MSKNINKTPKIMEKATLLCLNVRGGSNEVHLIIIIESPNNTRPPPPILGSVEFFYFLLIRKRISIILDVAMRNVFQ